QGGIIAAGLLLLIGGACLWMGDPWVALLADQRTAVGERRTVGLADGSAVELGPSTAMTLQFSAAERRVTLLSGEAYFVVAPMRGGEVRPFVVAAEGGTARALGTRFMVDRLRDGVEVVVDEHQVAVALGDEGSLPVVLSPGQSVRYSRMGIGSVR